VEGTLISFVLAAMAGLILSVLTWYFARKSGLQPAQSQLVSTLKDTVDAQEDKITYLEESLATERKAREQLASKVQSLQSAIADLASENTELRKKLGMPAKEVEA
jgi:cell shape-determining protein MreC